MSNRGKYDKVTKAKAVGCREHAQDYPAEMRHPPAADGVQLRRRGLGNGATAPRPGRHQDGLYSAITVPSHVYTSASLSYHVTSWVEGVHILGVYPAPPRHHFLNAADSCRQDS